MMKEFLLHNWPRRLISLGLAIIIWLAVHRSLTGTKTLGGIPVKVINIPAAMTVDGLQPGGFLDKRIALTLSGTASLLQEVRSDDLEVVIDATDRLEEWNASITKKNLVSLNPDLELGKIISKVANQTLPIPLCKLIEEKLTIQVTAPSGEPPRGYQLLQVWPSTLTLRVSGPEEVICKLKGQSHTLQFNLNDIHPFDLESLQEESEGEVISYTIPNSWKCVQLPQLSARAIDIDDPKAATLRMDFVKDNLLPIGSVLPVTLFFSANVASALNPDNCTLVPTDILQKQKDLFWLSCPLFLKGVDPLFVKVAKNSLLITISPDAMSWSLQLINAHKCEEQYLRLTPHKKPDEISYFRHRFRRFVEEMRLYTTDNLPWQPTIDVQNGKVYLR